MERKRLAFRHAFIGDAAAVERDDALADVHMVERPVSKVILQAAARGQAVSRVPHFLPERRALRVRPSERGGGYHVLRARRGKEAVFVHLAPVAAGRAEDLVRLGTHRELRTAFWAAVKEQMKPFRRAFGAEADARHFLPCVVILEDAFPDAGVERFVGKRGQLLCRSDKRHVRFYAAAPAAGPPFWPREVTPPGAHSVNRSAQQLAKARSAFREIFRPAGAVDLAFRVKQDAAACGDERAHIPDGGHVRGKLRLAHALSDAQQVAERLLVEEVRGHEEVHPLGVKRYDSEQEIEVGGMVAEHGDGAALPAHSK